MKAIVNFSTPQYARGQNRLRDSLKGRTDADFIAFTSFDEIGSPTHSENPYAFKLYAIDKVRQMGYDQILWLDASAYAVGDVEKIFNLIRRNGHFMEEARHYASTWTNDRTLKYFGLTRDDATKIPLYSAGFTGLNFNNKTTQSFFSLWYVSMIDGMFRGEWHNRNKTESRDTRCEGHRHDLSCASIIANQLGMKYEKCGKYFQYAAPTDKPNQPTVVFFAQGI